MPPINSDFKLRRKPVIAWLLESFTVPAGPYSAGFNLCPITSPVGMNDDDRCAASHLLTRGDSVLATIPAAPDTVMVELVHTLCGNAELLGYIHPGFGEKQRPKFEQYLNSNQHICPCTQMAALHEAEESDAEEGESNILDDFYLFDEEEGETSA